MPDDKPPSTPGFVVQFLALLVGIVWISCILITGIAGCFVCGYLADIITPNSGPDSFYVQCCVTVGGVVGAIAGGYLATKVARALRRHYSRSS